MGNDPSDGDRKRGYYPLLISPAAALRGCAMAHGALRDMRMVPLCGTTRIARKQPISRLVSANSSSNGLFYGYYILHQVLLKQSRV